MTTQCNAEKLAFHELDSREVGVEPTLVSPAAKFVRVGGLTIRVR